MEERKKNIEGKTGERRRRKGAGFGGEIFARPRSERNESVDTMDRGGQKRDAANKDTIEWRKDERKRAIKDLVQ